MPWHCLTSDCTATQHGSRGLCQRCYMAIHRAIERGETTWAELEAQGRALPVPETAGQRFYARGNRYGRRRKRDA